MKKKKCLYCYLPLMNPEYEYHEKCSKKMFGTKIPPELPYTLDKVSELASEAINKSLSVTGIQPKISLDLKQGSLQNRLTIVGLWGDYILKPPIESYPQMPEIEDLTMHLSSICSINTALHSLIRFKSGELAYITKRFDRNKKSKIAVEDMCQLSKKLTENKYHSSMEKIGKNILKYSDYPGLDIIDLFHIIIFCFLTGNADMHLKNFSLVTEHAGEIRLSPAYDLLATKLLIPKDDEELALTLNGKKSNFTKKDFITFAQSLGINDKVINNTFEEYKKYIPLMLDFIDKGFLSGFMSKEYKKLIQNRTERLNL